MTTLAQFRTTVASTLGLDNTTSGDQPMIDKWANDGVVEVLIRTRCQQRSADMYLTAGQEDYTLDTTIMLITNITMVANSLSYQLERVTSDDILAMRRASSVSVSPAQYYAVLGSDLFMIYPTPTSSLDYVTIYYVPRPGVLSASSDAPAEIPDEFQNAVEFYMLARAADYSDDSSSQEGARYDQQFEAQLRWINKINAKKGNHRMPAATVGPRFGRGIAFHDRSRYP